MLEEYIQKIVGLTIIIILLFPLIFIVYSSTKLCKRHPGKASFFIISGAVILAILSADYALTLILAFQGVAIPAEVIIIKAYISKGMNYVGLISIAVGMLFLGKQANA